MDGSINVEVQQVHAIEEVAKVEVVVMDTMIRPELELVKNSEDAGILLEKSGEPAPPKRVIVEVDHAVVKVVGSSELAIGDVYILLLGKDSQHFTKYVELVMSAYKHLGKMGYNVVGAFMSTTVWATSKSSDDITTKK